MSTNVQTESLEPSMRRAAGGHDGYALRLGIADDHAMVRRGLREFLFSHPDITLVGEAADGRQAIHLVRQTELDVPVLDLAMPDKGGVDALSTLNAQFPQVAMLILSGFPEEHYAITTTRPGAQVI